MDPDLTQSVILNQIQSRCKSVDGPDQPRQAQTDIQNGFLIKQLSSQCDKNVQMQENLVSQNGYKKEITQKVIQ